MNLPCIEDKCLKYPVCKHKAVVHCTYLHKIVTNINKTIQARDPHFLKARCPEWDEIHEMFPNLNRVWMDNRP